MKRWAMVGLLALGLAVGVPLGSMMRGWLWDSDGAAAWVVWEQLSPTAKPGPRAPDLWEVKAGVPRWAGCRRAVQAYELLLEILQPAPEEQKRQAEKAKLPRPLRALGPDGTWWRARIVCLPAGTDPRPRYKE